MREFKYLDPLSLKAFYAAATTQHFTRAAESCNMTQSGVSQHISRLEATLNVDLFVRSGRSVILSDAGLKLKNHIETYLDQTDEIFESLQREKFSPSGRVRYAMPASCLMTPHFTQLLERQPDFPQIDLDVTICHSDEVIQLLTANKIDFGFVTKRFESPDLHLTEFAHEEYVLVGSDAKDLKFSEAADLLHKKFISYPGMNELYDLWFESAFGKRKAIHFDQLRISGNINNLPGAITMARHGLGIGVFPRHCVYKELTQKQLSAHTVKNRETALYPIYLARRRQARPLRRVETVLDIFMQMKKKDSGSGA